MLVKFKKEVMDDSTFFGELDRIFHFFDEERHRWDTSNETEIENSVWINTDPAPRSLKKLAYENACKEASRPSSSNLHALRLLVGSTGQSRNELAPKEARKYLNERTLVAVEHASNDGAFIETFLYCMARRELLDAHTEGWWDFDHMGGNTGVKYSIERYLARNDGPIRLFVIFDSDRPFRNAPYDNNLEKAIEACRTNRVPCHVLEKRKIENYIPVELLEVFARGNRHKIRQVRIFGRLSDEQKDYFEMKHGFKRDPTPPATEIPENQRALFDDLRPEQVQALCGGFGGDIADCFKDRRDLFTRESLEIRCNGSLQEFEQLFDEIERLL